MFKRTRRAPLLCAASHQSREWSRTGRVRPPGGEKEAPPVGGVKLLHHDTKKKKKVLIGLFFAVFKTSTDARIKTAHSNGGEQ